MKFILTVIVAILSVSYAVEIKETKANEASKKFLQEYAEREDTVVLPSGLMYRVLEPGKGGSPELKTPCDCHYEGRLATNYPDGPTFDSSYARGSPTSFAPNQVIKGWTEAMQLMKVGATWELVCPPEIAYGARAMGARIPAYSVLVFKMEMIKCRGVKSEL